MGKYPSDEQLIEWRDNAYCPTSDLGLDFDDFDDPSFEYTSAYLRWLETDGTDEDRIAHEAKGLRAVYEAGLRFQLAEAGDD
jgi:hypothetical protein